MKHVILLLTVIAATLVIASGVALALTRVGGSGNDVVLGTEHPDDLGGGSGSDSIIGLGVTSTRGGAKQRRQNDRRLKQRPLAT